MSMCILALKCVSDPAQMSDSTSTEIGPQMSPVYIKMGDPCILWHLLYSLLITSSRDKVFLNAKKTNKLYWTLPYPRPFQTPAANTD